MDFYKALDTDSSRAVADFVSNAVGNDADKFAIVLEIACRDIKQISARAGSVIARCLEKDKTLIKPHVDFIIKHLNNCKIDGTKRCLLKALTFCKNLEQNENAGILVDICFNYIINPKESIAVKAYSMHILFDIAQAIPDLKRELKDTISTILPEASTGIKTLGKKLLKKLA